MSDVIRCVSPVDGRVYAERPAATDQAIAEALARARIAQKAWARVPVSERAKICSAAVDA
ncbi:aldehyde dehydrogenase family protein, partial [Acinetobacter baumannii]